MKPILTRLKKFLVRILRLAGRKRGVVEGSAQEMNRSLTSTTLKAIIQGIFSTREDEIACKECYEQLDRFTEMVLAGKAASEALPLVQDHLNRCRDCREEFEALLAALRALG